MSQTLSATDRAALLLGQWFGTGLSPVAPGTVGSLGALPLVWVLLQQSLAVYWAVTLVTCVLGVFVSQRCSDVLLDKDPSSVVIDEVAGVLLAIGLVPTAPLWVLVVAWLLFRLLDITKPSIIYRVQFVPPNGLGIMADDVLAGLFAGGFSLALWRGWMLMN